MYFNLRISLISSMLMLCSSCSANIVTTTNVSEQSKFSDEEFNHQTLDQMIKRTMQRFQVPGVAIGIVQNGKVIHLKGYGKANIDLNNEVNQDTIFKIASNSKAFTTAALAILVDQGKLNWRDKVTAYLPEFKMKDPWVTNEFNVIDLLTHRSGLRRGAGDLMLWPEPTKFTPEQVTHNLRYLDSITSFRDQYAYDNLLYIVAGELVAKISGQSWVSFVEQNLFEPLNMNNCYAGGIDVTHTTNHVAPHVIINDILQVDVPNLMNARTSLMAAAGGIKCSASDLTKWISMLLNEGKSADGKQIISQSQRDKLWSAVTRLPISKGLKAIEHINYKGYALGWRVSDYFGHWKISHTGTLSGSMSQIILFPELELGIIVLTNQQSSDARNALARGIMQKFIPQEKVDWVKHYSDLRMKKNQLNMNTNRSVATPMTKSLTPSEKAIPNIDKYNTMLGRFEDPWFGTIYLSRKLGSKTIEFNSVMSPRLVGSVYYFRDNQWWVKWHDRSFHADAWLKFSVDPETGHQKLFIQPIDPNADFSFDFNDLNFTKDAIHINE